MPKDWGEPTLSVSLLAFQNPANARVLDIGCGDGQRTKSYIEKAGSVIGIDPNRELLIQNLALRPNPHGNRIRFVQARAQSLPFPREAFDIALLSWSF